MSYAYVISSMRAGVVCRDYHRAAWRIFESDEKTEPSEFIRVLRSEAVPRDASPRELDICAKSNAATLKAYAAYVAVLNDLPQSERYNVEAYQVDQ